MIRTCENVTLENFKPKIRKLKNFKFYYEIPGLEPTTCRFLECSKKRIFGPKLLRREILHEKKTSNSEQYLTVNQL